MCFNIDIGVDNKHTWIAFTICLHCYRSFSACYDGDIHVTTLSEKISHHLHSFLVPKFSINLVVSIDMGYMSYLFAFSELPINI